MASKPDRVTEAEIGLAVMQILAACPSGRATVDFLVKNIPDHIRLTVGDRAPSETRRNEEVWEQQVRNLKSHGSVPGNPFAEGFVTQVKKGTWEITEAGRHHLLAGGR